MLKILKIMRESQIWKSVIRHGWPNTAKLRAKTILGNLFLHLHPMMVDRKRLKISYTFCLGGVSFLLFLILTATGVLLMFYYRPTLEHAYKDILDLEFVVSYGMFMRNLHRWAAHGMVVAVMLHMMRVWLMGAYKHPREFNWVIGVVLLILTLLLSFTGYLLPWDQLAFWAITVGTNMAGAAPVLGADGPFSIVNELSDMKFILLGEKAVGAMALLRFYVLHCVFLPMAALILMGLHFWRVRKDGKMGGL